MTSLKSLTPVDHIILAAMLDMMSVILEHFPSLPCPHIFLPIHRHATEQLFDGGKLKLHTNCPPRSQFLETTTTVEAPTKYSASNLERPFLLPELRS